MSGYVLDDLALVAGLTDKGEEHHRRELSRLLISAVDRGPSIAVPAMCLAHAALFRPAIIDHLADLVAAPSTGPGRAGGPVPDSEEDHQKFVPSGEVAGGCVRGAHPAHLGGRGGS